MIDSHNSNPNIRPNEQNIPNKEGDFAETPPYPRPFGTAFSPNFLSSYHLGVMNYKYKGVSCLKSPIDLAIYMMLIYDLRPGTIVEIGSFHGGAALFYADLAAAYGLETDVITVDFRAIQGRPDADLDQRIEFIQADAADLANSALHDRLAHAPRPWLVIEDSAHTFQVTLAAMRYFAEAMKAGDYLLVEDGVIEDQGANWRYDGGPNRAVHQFFTERPDVFEIDARLNDWFGPNCSFNPNGYLRRI